MILDRFARAALSAYRLAVRKAASERPCAMCVGLNEPSRWTGSDGHEYFCSHCEGTGAERNSLPAVPLALRRLSA